MEESGAAARDAVQWVGMQHLMSGFCGRAGEGGESAAGGAHEGRQDARELAATGGGLRLRRTRAMAVRVAPRQRVLDGSGAEGSAEFESRAA